MSSAEVSAAWSCLSLDLPRHHESLSAGESGPFQACLAELPALTAAYFAALDHPAAQLLALDVFMVDAMIRRHGLELPPVVSGKVDEALAAAAERLGCEPILSYPFYIRLNPTDIAEIRRFTDTDAEFRFIRMHRLIEDLMDGAIATLERVLGDADPARAFRVAYGALAADFQLINRTVAGFRDEARMPQAVFHDGFRPYFGPRLDPVTGAAVLEGPSGLQSPAFRHLCMLVGYRDALLDGWTERIGHYHEPATRAALEAARQARDSGRSLAALAEGILGSGPSLPHLHADYGRHVPDLLALAERQGHLSDDVLAALARHGVQLGVWPAGGPAYPPLPQDTAPLPSLGEEDRRTLRCLAGVEAMLLAFHVEHVAIAAHQIGYAQGTGGTSGVEFLLLATFRRAFPRLWTSGLGAQLGAGG